MTDLPTKLREFFAGDFRRVAPLWALAGGAGAVLGVLLRDPAWAQTGIGLLLAGLSTNVASSLVYDAVRPELDDEGREELLHRGLDGRDPAVARLVATLLVEAGPQVAAALPAGRREALASLLERGMAESGGALPTIAAPYAAALRAPSPDWGALRPQLHAAITSVSQQIEASEGGEASGNTQRTEGAAGRVEQRIVARGKGSVARNNQQIATGQGASATPGGSAAPEADHVGALIDLLTRRLQELERQQALRGIDTPPHVAIEIDDLRGRIDDLRGDDAG